MPIVLHAAPVLPGENPLIHPHANDPRTQPFLENMERCGVMNSDGVIIKPCVFLRRGHFILKNVDHYIWRAKWIDPS